MNRRPVRNARNMVAVIHRKCQRQWVKTQWGWQVVGEKTLGEHSKYNLSIRSDSSGDFSQEIYPIKDFGGF